MKGPKQAAIERGIRAVQKLGLPVVKVQFDAAGNIAWNAPGVWSVDNELVVDWD